MVSMRCLYKLQLTNTLPEKSHNIISESFFFQGTTLLPIRNGDEVCECLSSSVVENEKQATHIKQEVVYGLQHSHNMAVHQLNMFTVVQGDFVFKILKIVFMDCTQRINPLSMIAKYVHIPLRVKLTINMLNISTGLYLNNIYSTSSCIQTLV